MHDNILHCQGGTTLLVSNTFLHIPPLNAPPQEPLDILPGLLRCCRAEAVDLINLIAENSSPKEVLIVNQEILEQLARDDEDEDDKDQVSGTIWCLINVITVSAKCEFYTGVDR